MGANKRSWLASCNLAQYKMRQTQTHAGQPHTDKLNASGEEHRGRGFLFRSVGVSLFSLKGATEKFVV